MAKAKKEVAAVQAPAGIAILEERPEWIEQQSNRGSEKVTMEDMTVPRLEIAQDLSPQIKSSKEEYIEGCKAGMCFNSATGTLYGTNAYLIPVFYKKEWILWKDRKKGGGFGGAFPSEAEAMAHRSSGELEEGEHYEATETAQQYCLLVHEDTSEEEPNVEQIVVSMSKSKLKPNRQWNTMIMSAGGDRFNRLYRLDVVEAQSKAGEDYNNWKVTSLGYAPKYLVDLGLAMYEQVQAGQIKVARNDVESSAPTSDVETEDEFA